MANEILMFICSESYPGCQTSKDYFLDCFGGNRLVHEASYNTALHRVSAHKNISTIIFIQGIKTDFLLPGPALATHSLYHWNGLLTAEVQAWRRELRLLILGLGWGKGGWGGGSVGHLHHHFLEAFLDHSSSLFLPWNSNLPYLPFLLYLISSNFLRGQL